MKISVKQIQITFEDDENITKGFVQLFINGNTAIAYSMQGVNIIKELFSNAKNIMEQFNLVKIYAIMEPHILCKLKEDNGIKIKIKGQVLHDGKEMLQVEFSL